MIYNFKRALVISVAGQIINMFVVLLWGVLITVLEVMVTGEGLYSQIFSGDNGWADKWWYSLLAAIPLLLVFIVLTTFYFRNNKIKPTVKSGFYFTLTYLIIELIFSAFSVIFTHKSTSSDIDIINIVFSAVTWSVVYIAIAIFIGYIRGGAQKDLKN